MNFLNDIELMLKGRCDNSRITINYNPNNETYTIIENTPIMKTKKSYIIDDRSILIILLEIYDRYINGIEFINADLLQILESERKEGEL